MSNLNMSWGKKQLWFMIPIMLIGFLPLIKIFWFKGDVTKDLVISQIEKRKDERSLQIIGLVTNKGTHKWSSVTVEAEFFDAAGKFIDEDNEYLHADIAPGAQEHFKITLKLRPETVEAPGTKMVVKVTGGNTMPF